jgi:hypothetical protein
MKLSHEPIKVTDLVMGGARTRKVMRVVESAMLKSASVRRKYQLDDNDCLQSMTPWVYYVDAKDVSVPADSLDVASLQIIRKGVR